MVAPVLDREEHRSALDAPTARNAAPRMQHSHADLQNPYAVKASRANSPRKPFPPAIPPSTNRRR